MSTFVVGSMLQILPMIFAFSFTFEVKLIPKKKNYPQIKLLLETQSRWLKWCKKFQKITKDEKQQEAGLELRLLLIDLDKLKKNNTSDRVTKTHLFIWKKSQIFRFELSSVSLHP